MLKKSWCILLIYYFFPLIVHAKTVIEKVDFLNQDKTLYISVHASIDLNKEIDIAVKNGLIIGFNYEFKIEKEQWYIISPLAKLKKRYLLSYHHITSEYHIENPITFETKYFKTLDKAIESIAFLNQFPLIPLGQLPDERLMLKIRFSLADDNLPMLIKLEKIISNNWNVDSDWTIWPIP